VAHLYGNFSYFHAEIAACLKLNHTPTGIEISELKPAKLFISRWKRENFFLNQICWHIYLFKKKPKPPPRISNGHPLI
jgi:hypothetical protein